MYTMNTLRYRLRTTTGVVKSVAIPSTAGVDVSCNCCQVWQQHDGNNTPAMAIPAAGILGAYNGCLVWSPLQTDGQPTMKSRQFLRMVELFGNVIPTTPAVNPLFVNTDDYQQRPWDCAYWTAELVTPCLYAYSIDGVDQLDGLEYYELFDHLRGVVERHDGRTMPALTVYEYGRKESYANAIETELCKLGAIAVYDDNERQLFGYPYVEVSDGEFSPYSGNLDEWTSDDDNNGCRAIVVATSNNGIAPNGWRGVPFCCVNDGGTLRRVELPNGWHY